MPLTRAKVLAEAEEWIGTPYVDQQSEKGVATDCVGMAAGIGRNTNATPDLDFEKAYRRSSDGVTMLALFNAYMEPVEDWRDALPADWFVVRFNALHWHCMMVAERREDVETEFTVIEAGREGVIKHRIDSGIKRRIHSCFRIKGIKD